MKVQDRCDATAALMDWFRDQDIQPADAIEVMALTIVMAIKAMKRPSREDELKGARLVGRMITDTMEENP